MKKFNLDEVPRNVRILTLSANSQHFLGIKVILLTPRAPFGHQHSSPELVLSGVEVRACRGTLSNIDIKLHNIIPSWISIPAIIYCSAKILLPNISMIARLPTS